MADSGLIDIEVRVEKCAVESLKTWTPLTSRLTAPAAIVRKRQASEDALWPGVYAQGYNFAEFGLHTGNYIGGLRVGALTYMDDDKDQDVCKALLGAFRSWAMQTGLKTILNNTASAQAAATAVWFFAAELDLFGEGGNVGYIVDGERNERANEGVLELTVVCMPSRPS